MAAGETLWRLSQRYGVTVDAIRTANGLTSNDIERWNDAYDGFSHGDFVLYDDADPVTTLVTQAMIDALEQVEAGTYEVDPFFAASPASDISSRDVVNWDAAYDGVTNGSAVRGNGANHSASIDIGGPSTEDLDLTFDLTKHSPSSGIFVTLTVNVGVRWEAGDHCLLEIVANGGGWGNQVVATGDVTHGDGRDTYGHAMQTVSAFLPSTGQSGPISFSARMTAVEGSGSSPAEVNCTANQSSDSSLVAMELMP